MLTIASSSSKAQETKKQLGLSLDLPYSSTNPYEGLSDFTSLQPVPAPPRSDPATHVYRGIVPAGALESRDLAVWSVTSESRSFDELPFNSLQSNLPFTFTCSGGAWALKSPFISELSSHWISSFFLQSSHLKLPPSNEAAFDATEDHAQWIRARYPLSSFYWQKLYYCAWLNTDQYFEELFGDMGVKTERREKGFLGLGFYIVSSFYLLSLSLPSSLKRELIRNLSLGRQQAKLPPTSIKDLGEERRALRMAAGEN